jgi:ATP-dependent DNA helicase RecG
LFGFMREQIAQGRQIYIVYPLIKESEKADYANLEQGFETIVRDFPLPQYRVTACHGKMKPEDKEESMRQFKSGEADILVATSVIEVGVDIPNASVMVIESAERFGLAQLHQLRGRVGRGSSQSYCVLISDEKLSKESRARLEAMCQTNNGFQLAELDLQLRGAGDVNGTQQSGEIIDLKIANLAEDNQIVQLAQQAAVALLTADPTLSEPQHQPLRPLKARYAKQEEVDFSVVL